jgi:hypothetical protein
MIFDYNNNNPIHKQYAIHAPETIIHELPTSETPAPITMLTKEVSEQKAVL